MNASQTLLRTLRPNKLCANNIVQCARLARSAPVRRPFTQSCRRGQQQQHREPIDDPEFISIIDGPPQLVRAGKRHGPGLIILGMSPPFNVVRKC